MRFPALSAIAGFVYPLLFMAACAPSALQQEVQVVSPKNVPRPHVAVPAAVIREVPDPIVLEKIYDAPRLFQLAADAEHHKAPHRAIELYEKLLSEFENLDYRQASLFNLGMLHEDEKRWSDAIGYYERLLKTFPAPPLDEDQLFFDAFMRLGVCFAKLEKWWDAIYAFENLLSLDWADEHDRMEVQLGKGITFEGAGESTLAESAYSRVLSLYRRLQRGAGGNKSMAAEAAYRLAEMTRKKFDAVELGYPMAVLQERLETKCGYLLTAQNRYLRAIRFGDSHTIGAAGFRLGAMYEDLYGVIVSFQPPGDVDDEWLELYDEEVRRKVIVLLKKAIRIYEKALKVGRRLQTAEEWLAKLNRALDRIRGLYLEEKATIEIPM